MFYEIDYSVYDEMLDTWVSRDNTHTLICYLSTLSNNHVRVANYIRSKGFKVILHQPEFQFDDIPYPPEMKPDICKAEIINHKK